MGAPCRVDVDVEVRYAETDRMGVVHHSVYPVWFEVARTRLCIETGYPYATIEELGYYLVVTAVETRFLASATFGEKVRVGCWLDKMASRILRFGYEVRRAETVVPERASGATVVPERASGATEPALDELAKVVESFAQGESSEDLRSARALLASAG